MRLKLIKCGFVSEINVNLSLTCKSAVCGPFDNANSYPIVDCNSRITIKNMILNASFSPKQILFPIPNVMNDGIRVDVNFPLLSKNRFGVNSSGLVQYLESLLISNTFANNIVSFGTLCSPLIVSKLYELFMLSLL